MPVKMTSAIAGMARYRASQYSSKIAEILDFYQKRRSVKA